MSGLLDTLRDGAERIRMAVLFAFSDPAWAMRYLTLSAVLLIPVLGYVALLGWQARAYDHARLGRRTLPAIELPSDIGRGVTPFISIVLMWIVPIVLFLFVTLPLDAVGTSPWHGIDPSLAEVAYAFFLVFSYPELLRRALVHEERLALLKPFPSFRAILRAPLSYLFAVLGGVVALFVAAFGIYAFLIGVLFTLPIGHAIAAHVVMQWQRDVETSSAHGTDGG